jgi:trimethylamine--corrinoid protein Co-methyltransferase
MLTALLPALAGASLIYGAGMIESGVTFDCGLLVLDDELARLVKQCVGGIVVDDRTLAVDDIRGVGPFGDFLSLQSTLRDMRSQSQPRLLDRRVREDWEEVGASDVYGRATTEARRILAEHRPEPVADDVAKVVEAIVAAADREAAAR